MSAATFTYDTHQFVKDLREAGFTEQQAEAVTSVVRRTRDIDDSRLATKADIAELKINLAETKADLLKWIVGAIGFQTAAIIGTAIVLVRLQG